MEPTPMPKTRLLIADREAIRDAIIAHKFEPIEAGLGAEEYALADEARRIAYGPYIKTIEAAPAGAFPESANVHVNVGGKSILLKFGESWRVQRRVFAKHDSGYIVAVPEDDAYGARVVGWAERRDQAKASRADLRRSIAGTLAAFRSFEDLLIAWPEAATFIRPRLESRPEYEANVPAVVLADLTTALDLPPEDVAQAA
jgi:hypothetical protein